jgi:SpoIIAA-like
MPISLEHERDNVFRLDVRGMLRLTELEQCQQRLTVEMARTGSARLLFVLDGFKGWDPQDRWNDLSFYVKYGDAIKGIAIVGPEQWRSETLMFVGADLRRAPVAYFVEGAVAEARAWLTA